MRIRFKKGKQKDFIDEVIKKVDSPSLRGLLQFGFNIPYSTLKNYHNESRLLPKSLFLDFCKISQIDPKAFQYEEIEENWGKIKGGKTSS